jgi:folate-binding protein YgfZ
MNVLICDTTELAWLRVSGSEAETFLQGQLSNDMRLLSSERAQISSYNSAKGRMLAVLHLLRVGEEIFIELPRTIADSTLARLKMFVLRARVTLEKADDVDALALFGEGAAAVLATHGMPTPEAPLQCRTDDSRGLTVLRRLGAQPRFTVFGARDAVATLREQLPDAARQTEGTQWRRADIENGVPVVLPETRDHFVAQMANLDLLGGIAFDKGCYTGQEIIARLHYLGQLKRRMFTARIDGPAPAPGSAVHASGEAQAVGEIVDAVDDGHGAAVATLVLQLSARDARLQIGLDGPAVHLTPLSAATPA